MMTSNIGVKNSQDFSNSLGFATKASQQTDKERVRTIISKSLKNTFNPEFLNRLDDIIIFEIGFYNRVLDPFQNKICIYFTNKNYEKSISIIGF